MSLPAAYLSQKLTQPLPTKGGAVLRTIGDAANYVLALPPERAEHGNRWRYAAQLLLAQANVAAVSRKSILRCFLMRSSNIGRIYERHGFLCSRCPSRLNLRQPSAAAVSTVTHVPGLPLATHTNRTAAESMNISPML
jgi:hypothetical protein